MPKCTESRRGWECGDGGPAEWTYEGGPKSRNMPGWQFGQVGADGNPSRYPEDAYACMRVERALAPNWVVPQKFYNFCPFRGQEFFLYLKLKRKDDTHDQQA